jgi:hypothetical protein
MLSESFCSALAPRDGLVIETSCRYYKFGFWFFFSFSAMAGTIWNTEKTGKLQLAFHPSMVRASKWAQLLHAPTSHLHGSDKHCGGKERARSMKNFNIPTSGFVGNRRKASLLSARSFSGPKPRRSTLWLREITKNLLAAPAMAKHGC